MLIELDGKPHLQRVFDICNETDFDTYIVTDSLEIAELHPNFILIEKQIIAQNVVS